MRYDGQPICGKQGKATGHDGLITEARVKIHSTHKDIRIIANILGKISLCSFPEKGRLNSVQ